MVLTTGTRTVTSTAGLETTNAAIRGITAMPKAVRGTSLMYVSHVSQKIWKEIILLQELSKWDKRQGYEISATHSAGMTPEKAFNQWKGSPGHYALIVPSGSTWSDLITVGCSWGKNLAHCWFANKLP